MGDAPEVEHEATENDDIDCHGDTMPPAEGSLGLYSGLMLYFTRWNSFILG